MTLICLIGVFTIFSCERFVEVDLPTNQLVTQSVFASDATAKAAMSGVYEQMMESLTTYTNGMLTLYAGLSSDELINYSAASAKIEFYNNAISPANTELKANIWDRAYKYIYQANAVIEGIRNNPNVSEAVSQQLEGEAKFIRAFCHFYQVNLFGKVPYITSTDYRVNITASQLEPSESYALMTSDLLDAQKLLSQSTENPIRPGKTAVTALLSRVYLFSRNWSEAERLATLVIDDGRFGLVQDLNEVFKVSSKEVIWGLRPVTGSTNTGDGYLFVQTSGIPVNAGISDSLMARFEAADKRKTAWVNTYAFNSRFYHLPNKYKIKTAQTITEHNCVLRLAETYLIRAEARAELGDIAGATADLDKIRVRAGLAGIEKVLGPVTQKRLSKAISEQRQLELFAEWGHRWMDLKRIGEADQVLGLAKPSWWQPTDALYPIPQSDMLNAPSLVQNQGYQ